MILRWIYRRYIHSYENMSTSIGLSPSNTAQQNHKKFSCSVLAATKICPSWTTAYGMPLKGSEYKYSDFDLEPNQEQTYQELSKIAQTEKSPSAAFDILSRTHPLPPSEKDCLPFFIHSALSADELLFGLLLAAYPSLLGRITVYDDYRFRLLILMAAVLGSSVGVWERIVEHDPHWKYHQWGDEWRPRVLELVAEQGTPELMDFLLGKERAVEALVDMCRVRAQSRETRAQDMLDVIKKHWVYDPLPDEKFKVGAKA